MERPRCQRYPLYMLSIGYVYTSYLVYHLLFLFCTDLWRDQLPLLLLRSFLNHIFHNQHLALELPQCLKLFPVQISLWKTSSFWMLVFRNYFSQYFFSMILFLRLTHIDGERTTSVTISVDRRSSAPVSSWTSTNTGPSIYLLSHYWSHSEFLHEFFRRDLQSDYSTHLHVPQKLLLPNPHCWIWRLDVSIRLSLVDRVSLHMASSWCLRVKLYFSLPGQIVDHHSNELLISTITTL